MKTQLEYAQAMKSSMDSKARFRIVKIVLRQDVTRVSGELSTKEFEDGAPEMKFFHREGLYFKGGTIRKGEYHFVYDEENCQWYYRGDLCWVKCYLPISLSGNEVDIENLDADVTIVD